MSREIKFRAWNTKEEFMDSAWLIDWEHSKVCHSKHNESELDDCVLMQYTGLKDKNGVEIYEGDILEAEHKLKTQKFKRRYQVIFNEKGYWDAISLDDKPVRLCYAGFDKCEVIGNIYENSELIERD